MTGIASTMTGMTAGRLQLEVGTAVLGKAMDVSADAALQLVASMTQSVPHGLTFSPAGLSAGSSSRIIATL